MNSRTGAVPRRSKNLTAVAFILAVIVTAAPLLAAAGDRPVVGFLPSRSGVSGTADMTVAVSALAERFDTVDVDVSGGSAVPDNVSALVVVAPGHVPDIELYEIDQFLMRGGRLLFLLDGATINDEHENSVTPGNVFAYVARYGALVAPDLVVDPVNPDSLPPHEARALSDYPTAVVSQLWPAVSAPQLSQAHPANEGIGSVVFPWASSISLVRKNLTGLRAAPLATSSRGSWTVVADEKIDPDELLKRPVPGAPGVPTDAVGERMLALSIEGEFTSAFVGSPVLVETPGRPELTYPEGRIDNGVPSRVIVVACSRAFEDEFVSLFPENIDYFVNLVSWLTSEERPSGGDEDDGGSRPAAIVAAAGALLAALVTVVSRILSKRR